MTTPTTPDQPDARLKRLQSFLQADPGNLNLLRDVAGEALRAGQPAAALEALDALRQRGELQGDDEAAAVVALLRLGRAEDAAAHAARVREAQPEAQAVRLEGARALLNARRFDEALQWLEQPFGGDDADALSQMAGELKLLALWHAQRLDEAAELGAALSAQWPGNPRILSCLSAILFDLSRAEEATQAARRAYELSPAHAYESLHVLAGDSLMRRDLPGANAYIEQALRRRDNDGRIWLLKGSTQMAAGDLQGAVPTLNKALSIFPDHPGTYLTLAWAHIALKQLDEAEAVLKKAIEVSPAFGESHGTLATVQAMRGEREAAEKSLRRATMLDKDGFAAKYAQTVLDGTAEGEVGRLFEEVMARVGPGRGGAGRG